MRGKGDVSRCGNNDVGHDAALEAAHPVRQDNGRHASEDLEAFGQQCQGGGLIFTGREADEPDTAPGQNGAEDVDAVLYAPVDGQVFAGNGLPGSIDPALMSPRCLCLGDSPTEVTPRASVSGGLADRQETLGGDPAIGCADTFGDQIGKPIGGLGSIRATIGGLVSAFDHPADCLVGGAAECRGCPEAAELVVCGQDVQLLPR